MKKLMIPIVIVVALAAGAVVMYLILGGASKEPVEKPVVYFQYEIEQVQANLKNSNRFLLANLVFVVVEDETIAGKLEAESARIKDTINRCLHNLSEEEARSDGIYDLLSDKLTAALNEALGVSNFKEVLFNKFIVG